jgi:hypothetical protein
MRMLSSPSDLVRAGEERENILLGLSEIFRSLLQAALPAKPSQVKCYLLYSSHSATQVWAVSRNSNLEKLSFTTSWP